MKTITIHGTKIKAIAERHAGRQRVLLEKIEEENNPAVFEYRVRIVNGISGAKGIRFGSWSDRIVAARMFQAAINLLEETPFVYVEILK